MRMKKKTLEEELGRLSHEMNKYKINNPQELNQCIDITNGLKKRLNGFKKKKNEPRSHRFSLAGFGAL